MRLMSTRNIFIAYSFLLAVIMSAGCSESTRPDMLEPLIELSDASDISRTGATLSANIDRRGGKMTYLTLFYHIAENGPIMKITGDPSSETQEFHLTGLHPGSSYTCHIEGGTETATIKSNTISFSTDPNELPKLSSPTPLSTGPTGIIVEFSIIEDGGEPISEAGCEIRTPEASESRRIYIPKETLCAGPRRISITGLTPLTQYSIVPFASNSIGEAYGSPLEYTTKNSVVLKEAGQLSDLFKNSTDIDLTTLTIAGFMNGDDFHTLRCILGAPAQHEGESYGLQAGSIDLTDVIITEGGGPYDGKRFTVADELTTDIFADCKFLRNAILPNNATKLATNAFARCQALESLTISAGMEQIIPSADCNSLKTIEVSKANIHFSSIDGILFNHDGTEIIWFPCAKDGEWTLPSSITTIGINTFAGTSITSLTIPPSVTKIGRGAFAGSKLKTISLPDNLTNVAEGTFQNCNSLTTVYLGAATEFVGDYVFDETDISDIYLAATIPPFATPDAFVNNRKPLAENCTLHVPSGTKKIFKNNSRWGIFNKIEEY